ncbi:hypothetical protein ACFL0U_03270 [Pseudomonadota bacterium]
MKIYSKLDIVVQHLDTAIKLFFEDVFPISIHVLIMSSLEITKDMLSSSGRLDEHSLEFVRGENLNYQNQHIKEWYNFIKGPYNFSKHGNKDISQEIEWSDTVNDFLILYSIEDVITLDKSLVSKNMLLFIFGFFKKLYKEYVDDESWEPNDYMWNMDLEKRKRLKKYCKQCY